MSIPRLSFLYPHLFKPASKCEPAFTQRPMRAGQKQLQNSRFSTSRNRRQETYAQRYGTAAEPVPPPVPSDLGRQGVLANIVDKEVKAEAPLKEEKAEPAKEPTKPEQKAEKNAQFTSKEEQPPQEYFSRPVDINARPSQAKELPDAPPEDGLSKPLEKVLHMEPPSEMNGEEHKPPHLHAPLYVHHFDTFTLVRDLGKGGFTEDQSVTLMKAVRSLLAINMDVARAGLVSKSDVENETYLFRAACSELRTEILNTRRSSSAKMTTQRVHLQHEVEILSQKSSSDSLALKDDLRGLLDDRKMAVRMEQQALDGRIQELNYKITVALNSDSKSEVEGLRWVLTRRAAMAIAGFAFFILGSLRYSSYKTHERDHQRQLAASSSSSSNNGNDTTNNNNNYTVPSREMSTQTSASETGDIDAVLAGVTPGLG